VIGPVQDRLRAAGQCGVGSQPNCNQLQLCELQEVVKTDACHKAVDDQPEPGWCYVDPENQPGDDAALVDNCQPGQKRIIRFVDNLKATPAPNSIVMIACFGADPNDEMTVTPVSAN